MQTLLTGLLIILAGLYLGNRWLPFTLRQRLLAFFGKKPASAAAKSGCSSCSSCGNCDSPVTQSIKLTARVK